MFHYIVIFFLTVTLIFAGCGKTTITEPQKQSATITLQQPTPSAQRSLPTEQQPKQLTQQKEKVHMSIFRYIFYLGIILFIFEFIWKLFFAPLSALLIVFLSELTKLDTDRLDAWLTPLIKTFGYYLIASLTVILTLRAIKDNPNILSIILFPFIGAFILYIISISSLYEAKKKGIVVKEYEVILMFGVIILFIVSLFVPTIAVNPLTMWLFKVINWIYNLKVIGWLIGFFGLLFILLMSWYGIMLLFIFIIFLVEKLKEWAQKMILKRIS